MRAADVHTEGPTGGMAHHQIAKTTALSLSLPRTCLLPPCCGGFQNLRYQYYAAYRINTDEQGHFSFFTNSQLETRIDCLLLHFKSLAHLLSSFDQSCHQSFADQIRNSRITIYSYRRPSYIHTNQNVWILACVSIQIQINEP